MCPDRLDLIISFIYADLFNHCTSAVSPTVLVATSILDPALGRFLFYQTFEAQP